MDTKIPRPGIEFEAAAVWNRQLFFAAMEFNGLFRLDLDTGEQFFLNSIPTEPLTAKRLYGSMQIVENILVLIPFSAKHIALYNLGNGQIELIKIENPHKNLQDYNAEYKFQGSTVIENKIIMFGLTYPDILVFDPIEKKINSISWIEKYEQNYKNLPEISVAQIQFYFGKPSITYKNRLIIPFGFSNEIMIIHLDSYEMEFIEVGDNGNQYYDLELDNDYFNFVYSDDNTTFLDKYAVDENFKFFLVETVQISNTPNCWIAFLNHQLILLPSKKDSSIRKEGNKFKNQYGFYFKETMENDLVLFACSNKSVYLISKDGKERKFEIKHGIDTMGILKESFVKDYINNVTIENSPTHLENYLELLMNLNIE